ncbi:MAG: hypothetical protein NTW87_28345 [Planctomycetota bacterium]|nr:hypothetical protein [Planctomycetota bacterium]
MTISVAPIPHEMKRNGRPPDPQFDPEERLFMRFAHLSGAHVDATEIRCPDQSVNRGKYSKQEWVLLPSWRDWGIACFQVRSVPQHLLGGGTAQSYFMVEHVPLDDNYSHSEIQAFADPVRQQRQKRTSPAVGLQFRTLLSQQTLVLQPPAGAS